MSLEPPEIIGGKYRVLRQVGRGAMGAVYVVEHVNTGEKLALKVMSVDIDNPEFVERFRREARATARIASEHVVRITDADSAAELGGAPFLVMELLNGIDLARLLAERGHLPPSEVADYLRQAGRGIEKAHAAGIVHRDLKPENLFLHTTPEGRRIVKVLDFGIARLLDGEVTMLTRAGAMIGTPLYMAPEQAPASSAEIGVHTDIWSIGMIAVELLTGQNYWTAESTMALLAQLLHSQLAPPSERFTFLPKAFDEWFFRSCARNGKDRWPSVKEQIDALTEVLETIDDEQTVQFTPPPRRSSPPSRTRSPAPMAAGARGSAPGGTAALSPDGRGSQRGLAARRSAPDSKNLKANGPSSANARAAKPLNAGSSGGAPVTRAEPPRVSAKAAAPVVVASRPSSVPSWVLLAGALVLVGAASLIISLRVAACREEAAAASASSSAAVPTTPTTASATPQVEPAPTASAAATLSSSSAAPASAPVPVRASAAPKPAPTTASVGSAAPRTSAKPAASAPPRPSDDDVTPGDR